MATGSPQDTPKPTNDPAFKGPILFLDDSYNLCITYNEHQNSLKLELWQLGNERQIWRFYKSQCIADSEQLYTIRTIIGSIEYVMLVRGDEISVEPLPIQYPLDCFYVNKLSQGHETYRIVSTNQDIGEFKSAVGVKEIKEGAKIKLLDQVENALKTTVKLEDSHWF